MDQLSAHLDRGWDLAQQGDLEGAHASAREALELDPQSAEAYTLLGYLASLEGEYEKALDAYGTALSLDDNHLEALINAAELHIHPYEQYEEALTLCKRAEELAENGEERFDALLLSFDALLGLGRTEEARDVCETLMDLSESPTQSFQVGRALFEIGETQRAAPLIEEACRGEAHNAEAFYYLGLIRDELGDREGSTQAFRTSRQLDSVSFGPAWSMSEEAFYQVVARVLRQLPSELAATVRSHEVYVSDLPGIELVVDGVDPRALVLLDDISIGLGGQPTARLFVYQKNVERIAGGLEGLEPTLLEALRREIDAIYTEEGLSPRSKPHLPN